MIVVDASVLIAFLDDLDTHHEAARRALSTREEYTVHTINLAETLVRGARTGEIGAIASVISRAGIRELDRLDDEAALLAGVRASTGLKIPDCCPVVASQSTAARLATFDARVARAATDLGVEVLDADR